MTAVSRLFARGRSAVPDVPATSPAGQGVAGQGVAGPGVAGQGVAGQGLADADGESGSVPAERPEWADVVRDHSARVYRLAYRLTGNPHDAEDLTQDVFVRVFRSLDNYVPGNFEAWLHRITTNLFLDGARRRQRIRFDALAEDADARLRDTGAGPAERFDMTHLDGEVRAALMQLRPEFRAAVVLCDIEGLPYEEVADVLGVKLGTVRSRIHRGRSQLRDRLAHRAPGGPVPDDAPRAAAPSAASRPVRSRPVPGV